MRLRSRSARIIAVGLLVAASLGLGGVAAADPAPPPVVLSCGATITEDTVLGADVGPCPSEGIIVAASDITLDLNGHEVFGIGSAEVTHQAAGVWIREQTGVTVMNGTVRDFFHGVRILRGSDNTVRHVHAKDNTFGNGIVAESSGGNRIAGNTVVHNGGFSGVAVFGDPALSRGNTIVDNVVARTTTTFRGCHCAISLESGSNHVVTGNVVTRSVREGVMLFSGVTDTLVADNLVRANEGSGIRLRPGADRNTLRGNKVSGNGAFGITVESTGNVITGNAAHGNRAEDLHDTHLECDANTWSDNRFGSASPDCVS